MPAPFTISRYPCTPTLPPPPQSETYLTLPCKVDSGPLLLPCPSISRPLPFFPTSIPRVGHVSPGLRPLTLVPSTLAHSYHLPSRYTPTSEVPVAVSVRGVYFGSPLKFVFLCLNVRIPGETVGIPPSETSPPPMSSRGSRGIMR